jgi:hypothetical protein
MLWRFAAFFFDFGAACGECGSLVSGRLAIAV